VEILLQAKDDPSVLVSASEVWSSNGSGLRILGHRLEHPQERLLGGLGHALRLWPELEPALRLSAPTAVELTSEAAYRFVREATPALEAAGFAVLAPALLGSRLQVKLRARPKEESQEWEEGSGLFGIDGLCDYEWNVAIGDVTLTLDELRELAALKLPLVRARGQWIVLRPEDVEAALAFFEHTAASGEASAGELVRAVLGWSRRLGDRGDRLAQGAPERGRGAQARDNRHSGGARRRAAPLPGAWSGVAGVPVQPRARGVPG
jgi:non-specific serine/threonine protein kinase